MNQLRDLSDSDANKLLSDLISQNGDLQPDHLILALSRRFFRIAAQILLKGVRSNQIDQCISVLLHAPIEFDESFNTFLAALALENIYLPEVISSIPSVSEKNKQMLLPILAYHLISFEDKPNVEYSENWFVNENILLNAYQNRDTSCLAYQLIEYILSSNLDKLRPKLRLFNANVESINIPIIPRRITELTKAVSSYTKKVDQQMFSRIVSELQLYISREVVPIANDLSSTAASLRLFNNLIPNIHHSFTSMVTDMSGNLSEKAREYLNRSIEEKYSNRLQTSLPHVITFCYLAAISRLDNCDSLFNKFKEIASKIPDVIPNSLKNYQEIIVNPLKQYDAIFDKESELAKVINNACIEIRNIVAVGEYMLLEAVIHDEAAQITSHTMFYPTKYSQISMISTKIPKFTRKMLNQEENCSSN